MLTLKDGEQLISDKNVIRKDQQYQSSRLVTTIYLVASLLSIGKMIVGGINVTLRASYLVLIIHTYILSSINRRMLFRVDTVK